MTNRGNCLPTIDMVLCVGCSGIYLPQLPESGEAAVFCDDCLDHVKNVAELESGGSD